MIPFVATLDRKRLAALKQKYPGLISSDDIAAEGSRFANVETDLASGPFVYNLDRENNGGTHWVYLRIGTSKIVYVDPVGSDEGGWPPKKIMDVARRLGVPIHVNSKKFMKPSEHWCGHISLSVIQ
jgi:hypothetical protein